MGEKIKLGLMIAVFFVAFYGFFFWASEKYCPCKISFLNAQNQITSTTEPDRMFVFSSRSIIYHDAAGWHQTPVANLLYEPR